MFETDYKFIINCNAKIKDSRLYSFDSTKWMPANINKIAYIGLHIGAFIYSITSYRYYIKKMKFKYIINLQ